MSAIVTDDALIRLVSKPHHAFAITDNTIDPAGCNAVGTGDQVELRLAGLPKIDVAGKCN